MANNVMKSQMACVWLAMLLAVDCLGTTCCYICIPLFVTFVPLDAVEHLGISQWVVCSFAPILICSIYDSALLTVLIIVIIIISLLYVAR